MDNFIKILSNLLLIGIVVLVLTLTGIQLYGHNFPIFWKSKTQQFTLPETICIEAAARGAELVQCEQFLIYKQILGGPSSQWLEDGNRKISE